MKREFSNITRGKILEELKKEGLEKLTPLQFLRVEKRCIQEGKLNPARRSGGNWRVYSPDEVILVKDAIWNYYGGRPE